MMNKPLLLTLVVGITVMMMFSVLPAMAMNKGELIDAMAKDANLSNSDRTGRNPQTGATIKIASDETLTVSKGETLTGNIKVDGGTLVINQGGTVIGNVKVSNGGTIREGGRTVGAGQVTEKATIIGNIKVNNGILLIDHGYVDGNIKITNGSFEINTVIITGNLKIKESDGSIDDGTIDGNVEQKKPGRTEYSNIVLKGSIKIQDSIGILNNVTIDHGLKIKNSSIQMSGGIISGILDIQNSSVIIEDVSVGDDGKLTLKAKKVAKFKAGAALAGAVN